MRAGMSAIAVGKVAHTAELARLLDSAPEFRCLAVDSMDEVGWDGCEVLWKEAENS